MNVLKIREGFNRDDDQIPPLYLQNTEIPMKAFEGDRYLTDWFGKRLSKKDLEEMMNDYYEERGWDSESGIPSKQKLLELGLDDLIASEK